MLRSYDEASCFACGFEPGSLRPHMEPTYSSRVGGNANHRIAMRKEAERRKALKAK